MRALMGVVKNNHGVWNARYADHEGEISMSWNEEALTYLRKHREYVARDLESLRSGQVKITEDSSDASAAWVGRHQRQIAHLDQLLEGYEPAN